MIEVPRRSRLDLMYTAEIAIYKAMLEVEKMPPDVLLTDAINKLKEAKDLVGDYIEK